VWIGVEVDPVNACKTIDLTMIFPRESENRVEGDAASAAGLKGN
jgi:hypothetical protein